MCLKRSLFDVSHDSSHVFREKEKGREMEAEMDGTLGMCFLRYTGTTLLLLGLYCTTVELIRYGILITVQCLLLALVQ